MGDGFQRIFERGEAPAVMSLNVQAAMGPVRQPERSQLSLLLRHFLERFFNHETASPDGDGKTRLVTIASAAGLPGFMVAVFLWPDYHRIPGWPPHSTQVGPPPYWMQVNHHFFFVVYSFVVMGLVTIFEWDLFFPDLLDVFVLGPLPVAARRVFAARVAAIAIFIVGFLFDANMLAPFVLPMATVTGVPNMVGLLGGHVLAVMTAGLFSAVSIVALQSVLLAVLGERLFRRASLVMQGLAVTALVVLLLLFPVVSGVVPAILQSNQGLAVWFPPFWFLGIYQRLNDGASALPIYTTLARLGGVATLGVVVLATIAYPMAYLRRARALVEGAAARSTRSPMTRPLNRLLDQTVVRPPVRRAVFHFISQTILRVPRYRIYLVLYGGVGLSVVVATILRFTTLHNQVRAEISADGIRAAIGIVAFWVIAGLRTAFVSSGNQTGSWVLRIVHGRPPRFDAAMEQLLAAKMWALLCGLIVTLAAIGALRLVAPAELTTASAVAAEVLVGCGLCLLLTDAFFLNVTIVPFTGEPAREQTNLAFTVLRYFTFFPVVTGVSLASQPWIEASGLHFGVAAAAIVVAHLWLRKRHRDVVREHCNQLDLEEGEDDFPMKLGLRY
jgi:hypothetical protein